MIIQEDDNEAENQFVAKMVPQEEKKKSEMDDNILSFTKPPEKDRTYSVAKGRMSILND